MIGQKKVSTLILLQSSALIEQWEQALNKFLLINEEPPEYSTPSGRKKKRRSVIGKIQGSHDSSTGIVDIAMVGSLCKKGTYHEKLREYGYVDFHIPMFERMYQKRLKTYRRIGYEIYTGEKPLGGAVDKCEENSIFGSDNYRDTFNADLLAAAKEIIISSPVITGKKVEELVEILSDAQDRGLSIKVVTWKPDLYKYGDSGYWQQLQNQMREAGFEMCLVEEHCEHYCVIDRELVWYGSMSFLGKEDAEDSMMRVHSHEIAAELMELTFGDI